MKKVHLFLTAVNKYNPAVYGAGNDLKGCVKDATEFENIMRHATDVKAQLFDEYCTKAEVIASLKWMAEQMAPGDQLIWFHSGHGTYQDVNGGRATCRCLHDGLLWDGEVVKLWKLFPEGSEIICISDTCYSESNSRNYLSVQAKAKAIVLTKPATKVPKKGVVPAKIAFLSMSASTIEQVAYETPAGGVFTNALLESIRSVNDPVTWERVFDGIIHHIDAMFPQNPVMDWNKKGLKLAKGGK